MTDLTDAELDALENVYGGGYWDDPLVLRLIAEVRRLRAEAAAAGKDGHGPV